jgi:23S rRNA pseudouridine2605 synthase
LLRSREVKVPLARALSKLGVLSRAEAIAAIRAGRIRVGGRIVRDPSRLVVAGSLRVELDGEPKRRAPWRTILFHKPRGVVTTRRDLERSTTIYDVLG